MSGVFGHAKFLLRACTFRAGHGPTVPVPVSGFWRGTKPTFSWYSPADSLPGASGDVLLAEGDKLLTLEAGVAKNGQTVLKPVLYSTVSAVMVDSFHQSGNFMPERPFEGTFQQQDFTKFGTEFPNLRITGKQLGSNVVYNDTATYQIEPLEVLIILRAYKDMADTQYSRERTLSQADFETDGGARMNYRTYPDGAFDATHWDANRPMNITVTN